MTKKRASVLWLWLAIVFGTVSSFLAYLAVGDYRRASDHSSADDWFGHATRSHGGRAYDDYDRAVRTSGSQMGEAMALGGAAAVGYLLTAGAIVLMVRARR